ncbi:MAG: hydroxyacid dehydrogenase [Candidatus Bathyarchaeia archaeon]
MSMKVLISDDFENEGIEILKKNGFKVVTDFTITHEKLLEVISDFDALIVRSRTKVTRDIIERGEKLKAIARAGVGLDNIDVKAANEKGITVLNAPEALTVAVAELTLGLIVCAWYEIPRINYCLKSKSPIEGIKKESLAGKTIGIIGLGRIGYNVAIKAIKAFGMKAIAYDPYISIEKAKEIGVEIVTLNELLKSSDVITIHVPLTDETKGLIGENELKLMKKNAIIVNTSRGGIINEEALFNALASGRIAGAALDVFENEPPKDLKLCKMPNVVCTPHIGAQTKEAQTEVAILTAKKVVETLKSKS